MMFNLLDDEVYVDDYNFIDNTISLYIFVEDVDIFLPITVEDVDIFPPVTIEDLIPGDEDEC